MLIIGERAQPQQYYLNPLKPNSRLSPFLYPALHKRSIVRTFRSANSRPPRTFHQISVLSSEPLHVFDGAVQLHLYVIIFLLQGHYLLMQEFSDDKIWSES